MDREYMIEERGFGVLLMKTIYNHKKRRHLPPFVLYQITLKYLSNFSILICVFLIKGLSRSQLKATHTLI